MQTYRIQTGATFLYGEPRYRSQVTSQALIGDEVKLLGEEKGDWVKVEMWDGYTGWLIKDTIVPEPRDWAKYELFATNQLIDRIYESPDIHSMPIRDITLGARLPLLTRQNQWVQVLLPMGETGWVKNDAYVQYGTPDIENLLYTALRFLGIPYFWGGTTPRGIDCSGFTQLLFRLNGINLKRDAWMQYEQGETISNNWQDWLPGDVIFFSEYENNKVTHVAIVIGDGDYIHASTNVKINSFNPEHTELYNKVRTEQFTGAKRMVAF